MENKQVKQENLLNKFFNKYKEKVIIKEQKKVEGYLEMSGSRIMWDRIFTVILDYISWIIIAIFVFVWWNTRAQNIDCTLNTCNVLYNGIYGNINALIDNVSTNINSMPIGLEGFGN